MCPLKPCVPFAKVPYQKDAKEPYKRDDILQKRPILLRSLLIIATPYLIFDTMWSLVSSMKKNPIKETIFYKRDISF